MRNWNDDPYTKKARKDGYKARSAYKLEEINKKTQILKGAKLILDLGASPGSWTQYCLKQCPGSSIIAVDLKPLEIHDPRVTFIQEGILNLSLSGVLGEKNVDVVLSDMAPDTRGVSSSDTALSFELASQALKIALDYLNSHGSFVVKLFMGCEFEEFRALLKGAFGTVRTIRPEATRKHSREIFFASSQPKKPLPQLK